MFQSGNHQFLKSLNRKHILNLLRMHQGLTARQLSERTNLKIATVINLLKELEAEQQISRKDIGHSTRRGGKRPVIWDINPRYGCAVGVEWLSTQCRLALIDFNLQIIAREIIEFPSRLEDDRKIEMFVARLKQFLSERNKDEHQVLGLGIGLAGIVDFEGGLVVRSWSFSQPRIPLKKMLSKKLPFPVYLDNESNAGVLGLKWMMPELFKASNIIYLTIHQCFSGMGAGFIFNHELYRGRRNATGEWPAALFSADFFKTLTERLGQSSHPLSQLLQKESSFKAICDLARQLTQNNDTLAVRFWNLIAEPIAERLRLLITLLDPDIIVVGGDIHEVKPYLEPTLKKKIVRPEFEGNSQHLPLIFSPFGSYTNALGAAVTALSEVYRR